MAHNWQVTLTALVVAPILALTGCSSDSEKEPDWTGASEGNHNDQGAPPVNTSPGRGHGSDELCNDPVLAGKKVDAFCNVVSGSAAFHKKMNYQTQLKHSTKLTNGEVNVQSFVLNVMRSQRDVWREYFTGTGIDVPDFGTDIVAGREEYQSNCPNSDVHGELTDKPLSLTANTGFALYCPMDQRRTGHIALPANTLAAIWKDTDRNTADMAVAIVASRAGGQMLNQTLLTSNASGVGSMNRFGAASCLAGVWARSVYKTTDTDDLDRALAFAKKIPVAVGVERTPDQTSQDMAWQIGWSTGTAAVCSDNAAWLNPALQP